MKRWILAGLAVAGVAGAGLLAQQMVSVDLVDGLTFRGQPVTVADVAAGQELYAENCASCHGSNLEGQPSWRRRLENGRMPAPPHDENGHTWHHADRLLFDITKEGVGAIIPNYESDMPAFETLLTDDEIRAVLVFIKSTWPERQRTFQADITASDGEGS